MIVTNVDEIGFLVKDGGSRRDLISTTDKGVPHGYVTVRTGKEGP